MHPWSLAQPASYAMKVHLIYTCYLGGVAAPRTILGGESLCVFAERIRTPLIASGRVLSVFNQVAQDWLKQEAVKLAEVFQHSSSNVEGHNGYLSLRNHQLRGLDRPGKRAYLTAVYNFLLTQPNGLTAAERCFGQKPRSMFAMILDTAEITPTLLSPQRRAVG